MADVTDNTDLQRYELEVDGYIVYADYRAQDISRYLDFVYAPPELRGKGAAGRLMQGIMELAEQQGHRIVPICPYAVQWMKRHAA
jgi:uncharacterized protein